MPAILRTRSALLLLSAATLFFLYLFGLDRTGLLGPDEPRYAAIGRDMARSGDWITPRLYGIPWFEKPALLYWMTALGFKAGLTDDLAPRLPVALLSIAFLVFYYAILRRQFGERPAAFSTCILATSAGWLAYSHVAVTDLPLSACFAAAMLLVLADSGAPVAGVLLGSAVLAKGLVPLVLFVPALWYLRRRPRALATIVATAVVVALPWYALVTSRNGAAFLNEFFVKHHFERFSTGVLEHVQPFWFFVPVLLGAMFPWTPCLALLFGKELYKDERARFLLAWFAFGFIFFSISVNKLPGYLLPLLPAVAALCGIGLAQAANVRWMLAFSAALIWLVPAIQDVLPRALVSGLSRTPVQLPYLLLIPIAALAVVCWRLERGKAIAVIAGFMVLAAIRIVLDTYPLLDRTVSARAFWKAQVQAGVANTLCLKDANRSWRYGLDYYADRPIPDCK